MRFLKEKSRLDLWVFFFNTKPLNNSSIQPTSVHVTLIEVNWNQAIYISGVHVYSVHEDFILADSISAVGTKSPCSYKQESGHPTSLS